MNYPFFKNFLILFLMVLNGSLTAGIKDSSITNDHVRKLKLPFISTYQELLMENIKYVYKYKDLYAKDNSIFLFSAVQYAENNNWDGALVEIIRAIDSSPGLDVAYNFRGLIYMKKQMYDMALADFNTAIKINPDFDLAYFNRGNVHEEKGKFDKAFLDYTYAISLFNKFSLAYYSRGRLFVFNGEFEEALIDLTRAIEINPILSLAYNDRGIVYKHLGLKEFAVSDFNMAIEINPGYALAYFNRGNLFHENGEYSLAINDYKMVLKIEPENTEALYNIGNSYLLYKDSLTALSSYSKVIKIDPGFSLAYYNKAFLEEQLGMKNAAVKSYQGYIKNAPESDEDFIDFAKYRIKSLRKVRIYLNILYADSDSIAYKVLKKLKEGISFNEIGKKYSTSNKDEKYWTEGWFFPGDLRNELDIIGVNLETGEYSNVIKTDTGYFVLMKTAEQFVGSE